MTELEKLKAEIEEVENQCLKQLEEVKSKIEELKQETRENETDNRWKPKAGEDYWLVNVDGGVYRYKWYNDKFDNVLFNHTDIFPTKEQAEFDRERKRIRRELMKYSRTFVPGFKNWTFNYNYQDKTILYWYSTYGRHSFSIYFESGEMAKKAVKAVGEDRIKKYLFGTED